MISRLSKYLLLIAALSLLAGCKVAVLVVEGGKVQSDGPDCLAGTVCIHEVTNTSYSESFTALADAGWQFVKWNSGGNFLCEDSTSPTCLVANVGTAGIAEIEAIVASDLTLYIMPIFELSPDGLPITDTVSADGKLWAQPSDFVGVSYADMATACPGGVCAGALNGYDVTGWTWASGVSVASLLSNFAGTCAFPCTVVLGGQTWVDTAVSAGFKTTSSDPGPDFMMNVLGYTSESESAAFGGISQLMVIFLSPPVPASCMNVGGSTSISSSNTCWGGGEPLGAWLSRAP